MGVVISLDMGGSKVHRETETETEKIEEQSKDLMSRAKQRLDVIYQH
jgi:hypothetical protein